MMHATAAFNHSPVCGYDGEKGEGKHISYLIQTGVMIISACNKHVL